MVNMRRVLILDATARHALVAIRNLGQHGLSITAGSESRYNAGSMSKYASRRLRYPSPVSDTEAFVQTVERELVAREYDMLLPINQSTVEAVNENRVRFEPYTTVPFPPNETLEYGLDKAKTVQAARKAGIRHPKSVLAESIDIDDAESELGYPVVVKPCRGSGRTGVCICYSRSELEQSYETSTEQYGPVLFQEFIPKGGERGVYTLYDDTGQLVRVTVQRRLRSYPPEGGASTYRETVADPELISKADRLLSSIGWSGGVAMVEFRVDEQTGEPVLMEINPRLWGSLALSVYAGVEFPFYLYQQATGTPIERDLDYLIGVRARDVFTDVLQVVAREDKLRAVYEFLQPSEKPCGFDILSWEDPLPTLGHCLYYARHLRQRIREPRSTDSAQPPGAAGRTPGEVN